MDYNIILDRLVQENNVFQEDKLLNNMYNGKYKYTLSRFRDMIYDCVAKSAYGEIITSDIIDNYLLYKINKEYVPEIRKRILYIESIPFVEQKTPEWFKLREDMISASDAGYFLKKCGVSRALDSLKIKIGVKSYMNSNAPPLMHGNTYEDVTRAIYESRNQVKVFEHGILPSDTKCIGASPDGIVVECLSSSLECQSRFGRLLEIKNPYSREIDDYVKPEYMVQILQQQYTTQLPICDFVETTIVDKYCRVDTPFYKPYETLDDMLNDKLDITNPQWETRINNHNIPYENLTKFGNEKGLIVWYQKYISNDDIRNKYVLYPLQNKYDSRTIEKWIIDTNSEQFTNNFKFKEVKYWRLMVYSEKTVVYDQKIYENEYIPQLCNVWDIIMKCRSIMNENCQYITTFLEELETDKEGIFYNKNKRTKSLTHQPSSSSTIFTNPINDYELDF